MSNEAAQLLERWLKQRIDGEHLEWLSSQQRKIRASNSNRELHITLGLIPRKLGRADLNLSAAELHAANVIVADWNPSHWSIDTAARTMVLCRMASQMATQNSDAFSETLDDLCRHADLVESITLYCGIPLYPHSKALDKQIGEGLRTNIRAVFEAIAHNNPYPAMHFDENRWNHMVLKALFIDSTLAPIQGLDKRANPTLATMLCDYAHERWAAGRPVRAELWRCVGPFATGAMIDDLAKAAASKVTAEHHAGVLALSQSSDSRAKNITHSFPQTLASIANGQISWNSIYNEQLQQSSKSI